MRRGRLSQAFPDPSLPPPNQYPGWPLSVQSDCWRRAGRRRAPSPRAHKPHRRPAHPTIPRSPRSSRAALPSSALAGGQGLRLRRPGQRTEPARLAPFARPELRLKAESPSTVPRTCTPTIRGDREEASILTGAWLCPQTYRALRAPLPPLEDAPPPPPGRAGWSREERGESAEICPAPTPAPAPSWPGLGSPRCAGAARLLGGPIAARPPGRSLSGRPPPPLAFLMSTDSEKELGVRG